MKKLFSIIDKLAKRLYLLTWTQVLLLMGLFERSAFADNWRDLWVAGQYGPFLDDALRSADFNALQAAVVAAFLAGAAGLLVPPPVPRAPPHPWTLPPDLDPSRLTTYLDYPQWSALVIKEAIEEGRVAQLDPVLRRRMNGLALLFGGDPNLWPDWLFTETRVETPTGDDVGVDKSTKIESGPGANHSLIRALVGAPNPPIVKVPNPAGPAPFKIYMRPPATANDWPPGILAGYYKTMTVDTASGPVEVIDPDNLAIVKEIHPPVNIDPATGRPVFPPLTEGTTAAHLVAAGLKPVPGTTPPVYPAPENLPDNVRGIAYETTTWTNPGTGQAVEVIDTSQPLTVHYWPRT